MTTLDLLITYGLQPACEFQWFKNLGLGITECVRKDPFSPTFSRFPGDTQPLKNGLNLPLLVGDLGGIYLFADGGLNGLWEIPAPAW